MGDYHPGVVAVYKRMEGRYLSQMRAWRISSSPEIVKENLIEELGFTEDQFEVLSTLQELHSDGSLSTVSESNGIQIGGDLPESISDGAAAEGEKGIFLAGVTGIERTAWTDESISDALKGYSLYDYQPAGIRHLLLLSALLADDMGLGKTERAPWVSISTRSKSSAKAETRFFRRNRPSAACSSMLLSWLKGSLETISDRFGMQVREITCSARVSLWVMSW